MGYSLRDADFQEVWDGITKSLGRFAKLAYAVDPNASPENIEHWKDRGIEIFRTTDLMFVRELRARLQKEDLVPPNKVLEFFQRERSRITGIHIRLRQHSDGGLISAMYQDGLLHALGDVLSSARLGQKKQSFERELIYVKMRLQEMVSKDDPIEIAYWGGRLEVMQAFCSRSIKRLHTFFHPYKLRPIPKLVKGRIWPNKWPFPLKP